MPVRSGSLFPFSVLSSGRGAGFHCQLVPLSKRGNFRRPSPRFNYSSFYGNKRPYPTHKLNSGSLKAVVLAPPPPPLSPPPPPLPRHYNPAKKGRYFSGFQVLYKLALRSRGGCLCRGGAKTDGIGRRVNTRGFSISDSLRAGFMGKLPVGPTTGPRSRSFFGGGIRIPMFQAFYGTTPHLDIHQL